MFCRNCGVGMDNSAVVCVSCGYGVGSGNNFCQNCGKNVDAGAAICINCGIQLRTPSQSNSNAGNVVNGLVGEKSRICAGLLGIFVGTFGVHNFYLGYTGKGVAQALMSVLSCGALAPVSAVWALIEAIMIFTQKDSKDAKGYLLKD